MSLRTLTPSILVQMNKMMDDNRYMVVEFTMPDGSTFEANVRIAKANQQQAGVSDYIAMGLQVVNVIGAVEWAGVVGATFDHDGNKWEVREPTVTGADNVTRTALAVTTI